MPIQKIIDGTVWTKCSVEKGNQHIREIYANLLQMTKSDDGYYCIGDDLEYWPLYSVPLNW